MEPIPETRDLLQSLAAYGDDELPGTLAMMGRRAAEIVPELLGLSLGLVADDLTFTLVASDDDIARLDSAQYLDGGPCLAAEDRRRPLEVNLDELLDEGRWRFYAAAGAAFGVRSSLSLPLVRGDFVLGGINMYASRPDAFEGRHGLLADALGANALGAVMNADLSFSTRLEAARGPVKYAEQNAVDAAVGLIAQLMDLSLEAAHDRLLQSAARAGITTVQAARAILDADQGA